MKLLEQQFKISFLDIKFFCQIIILSSKGGPLSYLRSWDMFCTYLFEKNLGGSQIGKKTFEVFLIFFVHISASSH